MLENKEIDKPFCHDLQNSKIYQSVIRNENRRFFKGTKVCPRVFRGYWQVAPEKRLPPLVSYSQPKETTTIHSHRFVMGLFQ